MSFAIGSRIMTDIIECLMDKVPEDDIRQDIYEELIEIFEGYNCDTLKNCFKDDDVFEIAFKSIHPMTNEMFDEDDDDSSSFDGFHDDEDEVPDEEI